MDHLIKIIAVYLQPCDEVMMEHIVLFPCISYFIGEGDGYIFIVGINFPAAFVGDSKNRLQSGGGLCENADGTRGGNGQHSYVPASVFLHLLIDTWICFFDTFDKGVVFFPFCVVNRERAPFLRHRNG